MREMMASLGGGGGGMLGRVPGLGRLAGPAGMDPGALLGGAPAGPRRSAASLRKTDAARKKKRKQARKSRQKGRRR